MNKKIAKSISMWQLFYWYDYIIDLIIKKNQVSGHIEVDEAIIWFVHKENYWFKIHWFSKYDI